MVSEWCGRGEEETINAVYHHPFKYLNIHYLARVLRLFISELSNKIFYLVLQKCGMLDKQRTYRTYRNNEFVLKLKTPSCLYNSTCLTVSRC